MRLIPLLVGIYLLDFSRPSRDAPLIMIDGLSAAFNVKKSKNLFENSMRFFQTRVYLHAQADFDPEEWISLCHSDRAHAAETLRRAVHRIRNYIRRSNVVTDRVERLQMRPPRLQSIQVKSLQLACVPERCFPRRFQSAGAVSQLYERKMKVSRRLVGNTASEVSPRRCLID